MLCAFTFMVSKFIIQTCWDITKIVCKFTWDISVGLFYYIKSKKEVRG